MAEFKPGDVVFFKGHADPVTIVKQVHIWDGSDGSYPGYEVVMVGWPGPEQRAAKSLVSFEENLTLIENQLSRVLDDLERAAGSVPSVRRELARLLDWKESQG
jgi:hypothetical protein